MGPEFFTHFPFLSGFFLGLHYLPLGKKLNPLEELCGIQQPSVVSTFPWSLHTARQRKALDFQGKTLLFLLHSFFFFLRSPHNSYFSEHSLGTWFISYVQGKLEIGGNAPRIAAPSSVNPSTDAF